MPGPFYQPPKDLPGQLRGCIPPDVMGDSLQTKGQHSSREGCLFISGWAGYRVLFPGLSELAGFILPGENKPGLGLKSALEQEWNTVAAWSLGAHLCLRHMQQIRAQKLVLAAPFLDFCSVTPRERVLAMLSSLNRSPKTTVRWFWRLCGIKNPPAVPVNDVQGLRKGLELLMKSNVSPQSLRADIPVTIIQGREDKIVPARTAQNILEYLPQARLIFLPCGHFIPEKELIRAIDE